MKKISQYILSLTIIGILGLFLLDFVFLPIITSRSNNIYIPDVRYNSIFKAEDILNEFGFDVEIIKSKYNPEFEPNVVIKTSPRPFTKVKKGRLIKVTISGEKEDILINDYIGMSLNNSKLSISRIGLKIDTLIYEYNSEIKQGYITAQYPKVGKIVKTEDKITFVVSLGDPPNYYIVPNLINVNFIKAKEIIAKSGLLLGDVEIEFNKEFLNNTVLEQNLTPDVKLSYPSKINLIISTDKRE
tara:strand:+ start:113 stop:841 length:729 start_codon:yes stop_codon:yes gene_type:complete